MTGRLFFGFVCAVLVPALALHASAPDRHALGLTAPPFGWPRLLGVHLIVALPLGLVLALRVNQLRWAAGDVRTPTARAFLAAAVTGAALVLAPAVGRAVADGGGPAHAVARSALGVLVVTPWLFFGLSPGAGGSPHGWHVAVGALVALVPPAVYADRVAASHSRRFADDRATGRVVRARATLAGLTDLGVSAVSGRPVAAWRADLDREITGLTEALRRPPPPAGADRLAYGFRLIQLDRLAEADTVLGPVADADADAALVLAAADRDRGRWAAAAARSRRAVELIGPAGDAGRLATAYDGWAEAATGAGDAGEAGRVLHEALGRLPDRAAHYHLLLGRHSAARPTRALEHFEESRRLDPAGDGGREAEALRRSTPGCLLR